MRRLFVVTITLLLLSPFAAAWGTRGDQEPSTSRDARDGYMFTGAPQSPGDVGKVYFNGWLSNAYVVRPANNPNVAALGTGIAPADAFPWAMLGVWVDCNKDGYVGYGEPGLFEYPANLPGVDATLCPPGTVPTPIPARNWVPPHNDGKWIHEFIPIGWDKWGTLWDDSDPEAEKFVVTIADENPWDYNDTDARVWVDYARPEAKYAGGYSCYLVGWPRDTFQSAGGLVEYYDCLTTYRVTDALTMAGGLGADNTPVGQVSFKDNDRDQSNSTSVLNVKNPWGHEEDAAYVEHWDCTQEQTRVDDPTSDQADDYLLNVSQPKVPTGVNAAGSPGGQMNSTQGGFDECRRSPTGANDGELAYALEDDLVNAGRYQVQPDDSLVYNMGQRRGGPFATGFGPGTPHDMGAGVTGYESCLTSFTEYVSSFVAWVDDDCHEGLWEGSTSTALAASSFVNRNTLVPANVRHVTWYASVGAAATSKYGFKFPGTTGSYGSENCALPLAERLFECNAGLWWPGDSMVRSHFLGAESPATASRCTTDGSDVTGCKGYGVRVGQTYQLRDIDCYDHSTTALRGEGIHYGVLSGTTCT